MVVWDFWNINSIIVLVVWDERSLVEIEKLGKDNTLHPYKGWWNWPLQLYGGSGMKYHCKCFLKSWVISTKSPPNKSIMMGWTRQFRFHPFQTLWALAIWRYMGMVMKMMMIIDLPNETLTFGPPQMVLHHLGSNKIMAVLTFGTFTEQKMVQKMCANLK